MSKVKIMTAKDAVKLINDDDHVALGGFIGSVVPEELELELGKRYTTTGHPKNLSLYFAAGQGDAKGKSVDHLCEPGMVKFAMGGHWGLIPRLQQMAINNEIEGYNFPQGVVSHLFRDSAANKPGVITKVGLRTFVDPRLEGGKINSKTKTDWVRLMHIDGQEYLFYKRLKINVALLRGTTADKNGNVTMEDEALFTENLAIAQLVKNSGGKVIVQVKKIVENNTLNPQLVRIPGILVDTIVVTEDLNNHMQTFAEAQNNKYSSSKAMLGYDLQNGDEDVAVSELNVKKIIARRCALEILPDKILNLGIGVPEFIAIVAKEEGLLERITLTVEPGGIGGKPAGGLSFGATEFPQALVTQDQQFDFYDGGGLDQVFLGLAELDQHGNINVSRFGPKIAGCGGFINITQNAKKVYFAGTLTAGKSDIAVVDGQLKINQDGKINKFIEKVQQITFSAEQALINQQEVLYVTERAVFELTKDGIVLSEIAPGVDLQKDVLDRINFKPIVSPNLKLMDARIFDPKLMNIKFK